MLRVVIVDMGSRMNRLGGQARIASIFYRELKPFFSTYYIGYETEFLRKDVNTIMLPRGQLNTNIRKNRFSENNMLRLGYNLTVVRHMLGIDKRMLLKRVENIKPDVIIANSIADMALLRYLRKHGIGFRSIYIDHGSLSTSIDKYFSKEGVPLTIGSGLYAYSTRNAIKQFLNFFDMNIALNETQQKNMLQFTKKVRYISNGMDVTADWNEKVESRLRWGYGISRRNFIVMYMGRMFERQKNISTLIKAFMKAKHKEMRLLLVGEGPSLADYKELAKGDDRIIFAPPVNDSLIGYMYNIANLFVLPSNWEGFSLTMLEAAAHKLPIIISDNIRIKDFSNQHKMVTFKTDNPVELYKKIESLYRSKMERSAAIKTSEYLVRTFSKERMLTNYVKLIIQVSS